jgi:nucleoside-triphosphatase
METIRHIFLTGEKQVGKSTLWRKVLERSGICPSGFQTLEYLVNGAFRGYRLHGLGRTPAELGNDVPVSVFLRRKLHLPVTESFEIFGTALLELAREDGGFILMDELGIFERAAVAFRQAVVDCLNSDCHVLGVLQKADDPFLEEILNRPDVLVFTVTEENRNHLVQSVLDALEQLK